MSKSLTDLNAFSQKTGRDDGDATRSPDQYDDNAYDDLDMGDLNVEDDDDDYYDDTAFHSYNARNNRSRNTKPQGYMCDKCKQDFQSYAARLQHYRTSTKHHVCVHCRDDVDYLNIVHLRTHWKQTHRDTYCHLCDKHFPNKQKLHAHVEKEHYPCEPCKTYYKTEGLLHEHWKTSEQHQNASCGQCGLVFEDEYFLHMVHLHLTACFCGIQSLTSSSTNLPATSHKRALQELVVVRRERGPQVQKAMISHLLTTMARLESAGEVPLKSTFSPIYYRS